MVTPQTLELVSVAPPRGGPAIPGDLRQACCEEVLRYVEDTLRVQLDRTALVCKRRTLGAPTREGRWVRIEARPLERVLAQGWGGIEASAALTGVRRPAWYRAMSWSDPTGQVWWRADETELVTAAAVKAGGTLQADPHLSNAWWATLRASLDALGGQPTTRAAKLHAGTASAHYIETLAEQAARDAGAPPLDCSVTEWSVAHADMTWANLTGPECWILDWEDWGRAPRGLDAANLLIGSMAVPSLAARVRREFAAELGSRTGQLVLLALCGYLTSYPDFAGVLLEPALRERARLLAALR